MTGPIVVCAPDDFTTASDGFLQVYENAETTASGLAGVLDSCGACAGTDNAGKAWSDAVDPIARDTMDGISVMVSAAGQMHDLLLATAANHTNPDGQSAIDSDENELAFPPGTVSRSVFLPD